MRIFIASTSLLPAYGGPALSVSQLALELAAAGSEVGLWSSDGSASVTPLLGRPSPIKLLDGPLPRALASFDGPDVVHDNGLCETT